MALGSVAARGAAGLYRWSDSHYINPRPVGPTVKSQTRMARKRSRSYTRNSRKKPRTRRGIIRRRIPRAIAPASKLILAKAVHSFSLTSSTTAAAFVVNMMDITDPFVTSGTEQPLGYDQWKGLYNKAYVVGVKITLRLHNKGSTGVMFGISPFPESQSSTGLLTHAHYMELPSTVSRLLSPDVDHGILVKKIGTRRHFHLTSLKDEDAFHVDLDAEVAPTRTAYIACWMSTIDGTTSNSGEGVCTAEYLIRLYDYIVPSRSSDG